MQNLWDFTWKIAHSMLLVFDVLVSIKWFITENSKILRNMFVCGCRNDMKSTNNKDNITNDNRIMNIMHIEIFDSITIDLKFHAISLYGYFTNEFQSIFYCMQSLFRKCIPIHWHTKHTIAMHSL